MAVTVESSVFGLSAEVLGQLRQCFARYPQIERVLLFGSRARGAHDAGSDIDLAVFAPQITAEEFARLWSDIEALPIAFKMDIVLFDDSLNAQLKQQILRDGQVIYSRAEAA